MPARCRPHLEAAYPWSSADGYIGSAFKVEAPTAFRVRLSALIILQRQKMLRGALHLFGERDPHLLGAEGPRRLSEAAKERAGIRPGQFFQTGRQRCLDARPAKVSRRKKKASSKNSSAAKRSTGIFASEVLAKTCDQSRHLPSRRTLGQCSN
jgi:hypothetical protein